MNDQPKALRLARILETEATHSIALDLEVAEELRRQYALNTELLEALNRQYALNAELLEVLKQIDKLPGISSANLYARAAIAKATAQPQNS